MSEQKQSGHERYAEDLALYAVDALDAEGIRALAPHLEECAACRRELADLRGSAALLALSTASAQPPARARARLMQAIAAESQKARILHAASMRRPWWSLAPVFASLLLAIFAILLWQENTSLKSTLQQEQDNARSIQQENQHARDVLALMSAPDAVHVTLVSTAIPKPEPQIKTIYQQRSGRLLLIASNLQPLPQEKTYELWLLPFSGNPMPAGTFNPDKLGNALVMPVAAAVPAGTPAKAFAVTIEASGGSTTPTMPIVMMGAGQ